ncbi:MAG TPA: hypothetical protein VMG41_01965 [Gemmatimonadales bacterium]|nr:hypothetical protein [Gemmatimonadales bacterium]
MKGLAAYVGASIGGGIGWWIGARVGVMTAFFLMVFGTALGGYFTRRWIADYF